MKHVYAKDGRLYLRMKLPGKDGKPRWGGVPTDFVPGQEKQARALLDQLLMKLAEGKAITGSLGPILVRHWSASWVDSRKKPVEAGGVVTWKNDEAVMRLHVLPTLGVKRLDAVTALDLAELVQAWRASGKMAPKSVHNAYGSLSAMFRDAQIAGHVSASPCILTKRQLGPKEPRDSTWRRSAIFTRDELEALISDERIPMDRRVLYAALSARPNPVVAGEGVARG